MQTDTDKAFKQVRAEYHRARYLPIAIENARRNLSALENEARRAGRFDLLESDHA